MSTVYHKISKHLKPSQSILNLVKKRMYCKKMKKMKTKNLNNIMHHTLTETGCTAAATAGSPTDTASSESASN
jgi:hypothetical protein